MAYKPLPWETYLEFAKNIKTLYAQATTGSEWPEHAQYLSDFTALYESIKHLTSPTEQNAAVKDMMGLVVHVLHEIESHAWRSQEYRDKLYGVIKTHLLFKMGTKDLDVAEQITFLDAYYRRLVESGSPAHRVKETMRKVLTGHRHGMDEVIGSLYTLEGLQQALIDGLKKYLDELEKEKQEDKKRYLVSRLFSEGGARETRYPLLRLISFMDYSCKKRFLMLEERTPENYLMYDQLRDDEYDIRMGIIATVLTIIHREYKWFGNPKGNTFTGGSTLYKIYCANFSIEKISDFPDSIKRKAFVDLDKDLRKMKDGQHFYSQYQGWVAEKATNPYIAIITKTTSFPKFSEEVDSTVALLPGFIKVPRNSSWTESALSSVASQLTKWGITAGVGIAVAQVLTDISLVAAVTAAPPVIILTAGALLLWTLVGTLIAENLISKTQTLIFGWIVGKIDSSIDSTWDSLINYLRSPTKKRFDEIVAKLSNEDRMVLQDWMNTLLFLPEDLVPEEEKVKIRHVLGIEPGCKWTCQLAFEEAKPEAKQYISGQLVGVDLHEEYKPALPQPRR